MNHQFVCDTQSALGMAVDNQFVVVSLESGKFFHFNRESESFFKFFQEPQSLQKYVDTFAVGTQERAYLEAFCGFLLSEKILLASDPAKETRDAVACDSTYVRPELVRQGDKTLSQFQFNYP